MALETLEDVNEIGGFKTIDIDESKKDSKFYTNDGFDWAYFDENIKNFPIRICHSENMISFKIQNGPIKENGINGCQVDTIIEAAKKIIEGLNDQYPCRENSVAITKLDEALLWLMKRKIDRELRGVEGLNQK